MTEKFVAYERLRDGKPTGDCCQQVESRVRQMVERGEARLINTKPKAEPPKPERVTRSRKSDKEVTSDG